jgi:hypothetical protein
MQAFNFTCNRFNAEMSVLKQCILPLSLTECCIVVIIAVTFGNLDFDVKDGYEQWSFPWFLSVTQE